LSLASVEGPVEDSPLQGHEGVGDTQGPQGVVCNMPMDNARVGEVGCVGLVRWCRGGAGVAWKESALLTFKGYMAPFQPHTVSENDLQGEGGS
jgi:hypothetical protein